MSGVTPTAELAAGLRESFFQRYGENVNKGIYDERDLAVLKSDDKYVCSFIRDKTKLDDASYSIHECLKFRSEFSINDISETTFEKLVWERGAAYFHNEDKDGHKILHIRVREHKKDAQQLPLVKKFLGFFLEMTFRKAPDDQIVVLFDMTETGLSNLDMDLIKFVITAFKHYYPQLLAYMLVFEMPWLFNAAWKIVKTWLHPDAVKKLKFVHKTDIQEYVNKDQLMEHMGGTDKYKYTYIEGQFMDDASDGKMTSAGKKRVTFAEENSVYSSLGSDDTKSPNGLSKTQRLQSSVAARRQNRDENSFIGRLLTISPAEELEFADGNKEADDIISLTNTLPYSIAYKVKTTSPEKYRVRPSSGVVKAGSCVEVHVHLQAGHQHTLFKDKFLVMAMELTDETSSSGISELWKSIPRENVMEHRLRCVQVTASDVDGRSVAAAALNYQEPLNKLTEQVALLVDTNKSLRRRVLWLFVLQLFTFLILVAFLIGGYLLYSKNMLPIGKATTDDHCPAVLK